MAAFEASPLEIVSTRRFPATQAQVYRAWTDPERLARWWGPKGFTNTFHEFEPRPGGRWRFVMHGPNGVDYENLCVFAELDPPARVVLEHVSAPLFRITATFEAEGADTRVTFRMGFATAQLRDTVAQVAVAANEENFDRLAAELAR